MPFHHQITTRFFDTDRAGIVFFARYFEYCHAAYEALMMRLFGNLEQSFGRGDWLSPLVHCEADYARPTHMGEVLDIRVTLAKAGRTSLTWAYAIDGPDGGSRAQIRLVHVFVQPPGMTPCAVPAAFTQALAAHDLWPPP